MSDVAGSTGWNQRGRMKKIFHFDAPRDEYRCDAAVRWCFDHRFELGFRKFLKCMGVKTPDPIKISGGAKQIRKSSGLHGTRRVILMVHSDCGAYGGLMGRFGGDTAAEAAHHQRELHRAAAYLKTEIPGLEVQGYFVDFEEIWDAAVGTIEIGRVVV